MNLFYFEFILSKNCNQGCSYCDLLTKGITEQSVADLNYIEWVIDVIPAEHLFIGLSGGEPGLISNLPDIVNMIKSKNKVDRVQIMSNGLVRVNYPELIPELDMYNEHLVTRIVDTELIKFYSLDFEYHKNIKNVIVLDDITTASILNNFDYFKQYGLFDDEKFWLKSFVPRSGVFDTDHKNNIFALYDKLNTEYSNYAKQQLTTINETARTACKHVSFLPAVDVDDQTIIHCTYHDFTDRVMFNCTPENLSKLVNKTLFADIQANYCKHCYLYYGDHEFLTSKNQQNRRAWLPEGSDIMLYI